MKILTNSMEQNPSSKANGFSASQEISLHLIVSEGSLPCLQRPSTCLCVLSHINPVHARHSVS